jgi:Dyp-type peroxidase family
VINAGVLSKNVGASSELTLMAQIRPGFVSLPDPMSYSTRLQKLLSNLFDARKRETEEGSRTVGPVDRLRTIHFFRFAIFDEGRRLLLAVSFDRPWEPYINRLVDDAGPLLDSIFSHCEGYEGHSTRDGYLKFAEWVRSRQQACDFFFAAFPGKSVDDILYLMQLQKNANALVSEPNSSKSPATLPLDSQLSTLTPPDLGLAEYMNLYRTTVGLFRLRSLFPDNPVLDPNYSDRAVFDRGAASVIGSFDDQGKRFPDLPPAIANTYRGISAWYAKLREEPQAKPAALGKPFDDVQSGILEPHQDFARDDGQAQSMSHGAAVLLQLPTPDLGDNAAAIVKNLFAFLISKCQLTCGVRYNIAFTAEGLKRLGLSEQTLAEFPVEFLQGMADRAALLGDVASNHPSRWRLPKVNVDRATGLDVQLSLIDAVVIVQACLPSAPGDHDWSKAHPLYDHVKLLETNGCSLLHVQALRRYESRRDPASGLYREHFGFLDGFTQPVTRDSAAMGAAGNNEVARGEVLLGHPNDSGETFAADNPLLENGSFLVLRKLSQNVKAFREQVGNAASPLATKFMGRSADGLPAVDPTLKPMDDFDYSRDADGARCPLQSHVRLANPRTQESVSSFGRRKRVPRIIRRGFSYGQPYDDNPHAERGLLFMVYNASIAQQYEVIQRWLNGANSTGLDSGQRCPLTAAVEREGGTTFRYRDGNTVKTVPLSTQLSRVEWGMYLFAPSVVALGLLRDRLLEQIELLRQRAEGITRLTSDEQSVVAKGQRLLAQLQLEPDPNAWRRVLEEQGARKKSFSVLTAIRVNHRVLRTPLGVLVAGGRETLEVLKREDLFSTRDYWRRMNESEMKMHLGMDMRPLRESVCPARAGGAKPADADYVEAVAAGQADYFLESIANEQISRITRTEAFRESSLVVSRLVIAAVASALSIVEHVEKQSNDRRDPALPYRVPLDLPVLAEQTVAKLSQLWFGLPDGNFMLSGGQPVTTPGEPHLSSADDPVSYCPADFTVFSQYVFRPEPDEWTATLSAKRGKRVTHAARQALEQMRARDSQYEHSFIRELARRGAEKGATGEKLNDLVVRATVGAVDGFVAAAFGSFLSVVGQWLESDELWRIQRAVKPTQLLMLANQPSANSMLEAELLDATPLAQQAVRALAFFPKPPWLHRLALRDTRLGDVQIKKGERVSVHLGQAAIELGPDLLFGGRYDVEQKNLATSDRAPTHACPGKEVSMGVLLGMLVGILNLKNVQLDGPLTLTFEPDSTQIEAAIEALKVSKSG